MGLKIDLTVHDTHCSDGTSEIQNKNRIIKTNSILFSSNSSFVYHMTHEQHEQHESKMKNIIYSFINLTLVLI